VAGFVSCEATPRHYGLRHRQFRPAAQPDSQSGVRGERASHLRPGRVAAACRLAPGGLKRGAGKAAAARTLAGGRARACDSVAGNIYRTQEDFIVADRQQAEFLGTVEINCTKAYSLVQSHVHG